MPKLFWFDGDAPQPSYPQPYQRQRKPYGFFGFVFDCAMTLVTGGLWLIWIFVREMRR